MATAYTGTLTAGANTYYFTASDVSGEYWIFSDGSSDLVFTEPTVLRDVYFSTTAGTTNRVNIYAGGMDTGKILIQNANQGTTVLRQLQSNPVSVKAGAKLRFKMLT